MKLAGKVAVITGASSGIGKATALLFAQQGARVVVADIDENRGQEVVAQIKSEGGESSFVSVDVTRSVDVQKMLAYAAETYGKIDILFNNAGISQRVNPITEVPEEEWERVINIDLKGVWLGCKHIVPYMRKNGGGVIINTASIAGMVGMPKISSYAAAKGGVLILTKALARELAEFNIRVNCVCPGTTWTPNVERLIAESPDPEATRKFFVFESPAVIRRFGKPEEIANAVLYLTSEEAAFVTGSALVIDGGWTA